MFDFASSPSLNDSQPNYRQSIVPAFREFLAVFIQPDVYEAGFPPNPYPVPLQREDLDDWKKKSMPICERHGVNLAYATERAHKRIFDDFRSVLAALNKLHHNVPVENWSVNVDLQKFVLMPIPSDFSSGAMVLLARHLSNMEAAIQASFPQLRKSLEEWGIYQPYNRSGLLMPALKAYLSLRPNLRMSLHPDLRSKNNEVISNIATDFEYGVKSYSETPNVPQVRDTRIHTLHRFAESTSFGWRERLTVECVLAYLQRRLKSCVD